MEIRFLSSLHEANPTEHCWGSDENVERTFPQTFRHPTFYLWRSDVPGVTARPGQHSCPGHLNPESRQPVHVWTPPPWYLSSSKHHSGRVSSRHWNLSLKSRKRTIPINFLLFFSDIHISAFQYMKNLMFPINWIRKFRSSRLIKTKHFTFQNIRNSQIKLCRLLWAKVHLKSIVQKYQCLLL